MAKEPQPIPPPKMDAEHELAAIKHTVLGLDHLDRETRNRILRYICDRYNFSTPDY